MKTKTTNEKRIKLYGFDLGKRYYLTHPWKWFHDLRVLIKNAHHRMRYGYAWVDLWNMNDYLGELIPNMLRTLADKATGWPQSDRFQTFEDWQNHLRKLADMFDKTEVNLIMMDDPLHDKYYEARAKARERGLNSKYTEEEQQAVSAWFDHLHEEEAKQDQLRKEVFSELANIWKTLWD